MPTMFAAHRACLLRAPPLSPQVPSAVQAAVLAEMLGDASIRQTARIDFRHLVAMNYAGEECNVGVRGAAALRCAWGAWVGGHGHNA